MLTRERRSLIPPPTLPDFGRTGRKGKDHSGLPTQATLPPLTSALSRRAALFGAVTVAGASISACGPAKGHAAALSANDARLVAIADELRAVYDRTTSLGTAYRSVEDHPEWDGLIARFEPLEDEMAETAADTLAGALAKARALQIPTCRDCARPELGNSLADDLVRLAAGALS